MIIKKRKRKIKYNLNSRIVKGKWSRNDVDKSEINWDGGTSIGSFAFLN